MTPEERLASLGIELPAPVRPAGTYAPAVQVGALLFVSGQVPVRDGVVAFRGKVGREVTPEQAYEAARLCALNGLSAARAALGSLDRIRRVARTAGYVASAEGFSGQPAVVNGASDLLAEVFGERGVGARAAIGVAELPLGVPVEVEFVFEVET
ncbi:MAG TPA: RidA family protein [Dehalococcoidia bacterium]|nr:RidA family protein [Dehalococcoidia bacterium]